MRARDAIIVDDFLGFTCSSCNHLLPETLENLSKSNALAPSVCHHCWQPISTQSKQQQLKAYLDARIMQFSA